MNTLTLPFPPTTGNHQHITARNGRRFLRKDILAWRDMVAYEVLQQDERFLTLAPLSMSMHAYMPDNKRRDLDNICKVVNDALQEAGMILDDSAIRDLHLVHCGVDKINPRVEIHINRIDI